MQRLVILLATWFGFGLLPRSPGTWGTLGAVPFILIVNLMGGPLVQMLVALALLPVAIFSAQAYQDFSGKHDSPEVVIDEVLGFLVAMTWLPMTWQSFVFAFVLFRLLDIFKPFPIGYLDRKITGGLGVVVDDLVAGIVTNIVLQLIYNETTWLGVRNLVIRG